MLLLRPAPAVAVIVAATKDGDDAERTMIMILTMTALLLLHTTLIWSQYLTMMTMNLVTINAVITIDMYGDEEVTNCNNNDDDIIVARTIKTMIMMANGDPKRLEKRVQ